MDFRGITPRPVQDGDYLMAEARGSNPNTSTPALIDPASVGGWSDFDTLSGGTPGFSYTDIFTISGGNP